MYHAALKLKVDSLGVMHPSTAVTLVNIGSVYKALADHDKALDFFSRALQIRSAHYGEIHKDTASRIHLHPT